MKITDEAIEEFIALWQQAYEEEITKDQAHEYASQLLRLLKAAYGPS